MRVLVCGGRDYANWQRVYKVLDELHAKTKVAVLIQGGACGADLLARRWAEDRGIPSLEFRANWKEHGKSAGGRRNLTMLLEGKPDLVIAFPGGRGTANMRMISKKHKVPTVELG